MPDITAKILSIITECINPAAFYLLKSEANLDEIGLSSIDRMYSIPVEVEKAFNLDEFPEGEIQGWQMVSDIVASVEARKAA